MRLNYLFFVISIFIFIFSCNKEKNIINENKIHIRHKNNIEYYLNKEANYQTEKAVKYSFEQWENKSHFNFIYNGRHRAGIRRDNKNTVSFLIKWQKNIPADKIAWCHNWYDRDGNIIEIDIIFNMTITKFTTLESKSKMPIILKVFLHMR